TFAMSKISMGIILPLGLVATSVLVPILAAQTAPPKSVDEIKVDKWNSLPLHGRDYAGVKSASAPRRDLSGIWDATGDRTNTPPAGIQINGANEHRSVLAGRSAPQGGEPDEKNIPNPLPYTPLGEASLKT